MAPINDYMSSEMKETFKDSLLENKNTVDGKTYTLPNTGQIWRLIYNKDIFKQAGIENPPKNTGRDGCSRQKKITETGKKRTAYTASPARSRAQAASGVPPIP
ncbi:hypothetical protein ACFTAO_35430 [Paenibacillus rhizoplanae]